MEQNLRTGGMDAPGAWARAHERPTGAAMAAVPRAVRTGCSICQRGASLKTTQTQSLPPPGTGKARHLWTQTTVYFNHGTRGGECFPWCDAIRAYVCIAT